MTKTKSTKVKPSDFLKCFMFVVAVILFGVCMIQGIKEHHSEVKSTYVGNENFCGDSLENFKLNEVNYCDKKAFICREIIDKNTNKDGVIFVECFWIEENNVNLNIAKGG